MSASVSRPARSKSVDDNDAVVVEGEGCSPGAGRRGRRRGGRSSSSTHWSGDTRGRAAPPSVHVRGRGRGCACPSSRSSVSSRPVVYRHQYAGARRRARRRRSCAGTSRRSAPPGGVELLPDRPRELVDELVGVDEVELAGPARGRSRPRSPSAADPIRSGAARIGRCTLTTTSRPVRQRRRGAPARSRRPRSAARRSRGTPARS